MHSIDLAFIYLCREGARRLLWCKSPVLFHLFILHDKDAVVRTEALKVLKRIGKLAARPELKAIVSALRSDTDEGVKRAALATWAKLYGG